jgi:hypothetical protein
MRFERIYLAAMTYLVAILITAFALSGCKALKSLTAPPDGLTGRDSFSLTTNLTWLRRRPSSPRPSSPVPSPLPHREKREKNGGSLKISCFSWAGVPLSR